MNVHCRLFQGSVSDLGCYEKLLPIYLLFIFCLYLSITMLYQQTNSPLYSINTNVRILSRWLPHGLFVPTLCMSKRSIDIHIYSPTCLGIPSLTQTTPNNRHLRSVIDIGPVNESHRGFVCDFCQVFTNMKAAYMKLHPSTSTGGSTGYIGSSQSGDLVGPPR
jgi:hypothetical protein